MQEYKMYYSGAGVFGPYWQCSLLTLGSVLKD